MKRNVRRWPCVLLLAASLIATGVSAMPYLAAHRQAVTANEAVAAVQAAQRAQESDSQGDSPPSTMEPEPEEAKDPLLAAMEEYNQHLAQYQQLESAEDYATPGLDLYEFGLEGDAPVGYLTIPAMELQLPVYLGATRGNLDKGAAVLGQTSMPVGGENTNCVIAAHRGWRGAAMLRDIERLALGDVVQLDNLWGTLTYEVVEIQIISPDEVEAVKIQEGRDLLTLVTCHPYLSSAYRYIVRCQRVEPQAPADGENTGSTPAPALPSSVPDQDVGPWETPAPADSSQKKIQVEQRLQGISLGLCIGATVVSCIYFWIERRKEIG